MNIENLSLINVKSLYTLQVVLAVRGNVWKIWDVWYSSGGGLVSWVSVEHISKHQSSTFSIHPAYMRHKQAWFHHSIWDTDAECEPAEAGMCKSASHAGGQGKLECIETEMSTEIPSVCFIQYSKTIGLLQCKYQAPRCRQKAS